MNRRTFLGTLAGGLLAIPLAAEAQKQGEPVPRIAFLTTTFPEDSPNPGVAPGVIDAALADALGRYPASSPTRNAMLAAISEQFRAAPAAYNAQMSFSSRRR